MPLSAHFSAEGGVVVSPLLIVSLVIFSAAAILHKLEELGLRTNIPYLN